MVVGGEETGCQGGSQLSFEICSFQMNTIPPINISLNNIPDNWLITGGCGFIGTSLVNFLRKNAPGTNIRILDNLSVGTRSDLESVSAFTEKSGDQIESGPAGTELIVGDILNFDICLKASTGIDIIVHLAANTGVAPSVDNPRQDMESNIIGIFNMLEAARERDVSHFIFASSGAPVGEIEPPITEEKAPRPVSPYGASKLAGEGYCSAYYRTYGIKTVSLRFSNVYGPLSGHKNSVVARFFKQALDGEPLEIYGDGRQTRDFIYIEDLIRAIILASVTVHGGEVFQIATNRETTINEIAEMIRDIVNPVTGKALQVSHTAQRRGDVLRNYADISKAERVLGYSPKMGLTEGLQLTFDYFRGAFPDPKTK